MPLSQELCRLAAQFYAIADPLPGLECFATGQNIHKASCLGEVCWSRLKEGEKNQINYACVHAEQYCL